MSETLQLSILAIIQGLSEFLPISSSAHLVLPTLVLGWPDQGLFFDVAVHLGTLMAVLVYFRAELRSMLSQALGAGVHARDAELWKIAVATLPAVSLGLGAADLIESHARGLLVVAITTLVFGVLLGLASRKAVPEPGGDTLEVSWPHALIIGVAQALALIPGVSRSGVTITAAMFLGYPQGVAARFSFLLSIPLIGGAMLFLLIRARGEAVLSVPVPTTVLAAVLAGTAAYATIALFLRLLDRIGMIPFVVYRLLLGTALLGLWFIREW